MITLSEHLIVLSQIVEKKHPNESVWMLFRIMLILSIKLPFAYERL